MADGSDDDRVDGAGTPEAAPDGGPPAPRDLEAGLHQLHELVAAAKTMPLSASIMLNKAELEDLVAELREALPEELRQARWVLREREDIIAEARREAGRIRADAEDERDRMLSRTEVVKAADREAERIVGEARERARQLRLEAEDYVDAKLANFEVVLQKTLQAVERGREKLQGTLHTDQLPEEPEVEDPGSGEPAGQEAR